MYYWTTNPTQPCNYALVSPSFWYSAPGFNPYQFISVHQQNCFEQRNLENLNSLPLITNYSANEKKETQFNKLLPFPSSNELSQQEFIENKKKKKKRQNQTPGRNINSNIIKYFVKYLYDEAQKQLLQKKLNLVQLSYNDFVYYLKKKIPKNSSYIRPGIIRQICLGIGSSQKISKAFRALFRIFIDTQFPIMISHLWKITKQGKVKYISARRKLLSEIFRENDQKEQKEMH